jgi:hypothetical protein
MRGRQAKYPFNPAMQRRRMYKPQHVGVHDALQKLVSRLVVTDIADAERIRYTADLLVKAKMDVTASLRTLDKLTRAFAEQIQHIRPIVVQLVSLPDGDDEQTALSTSELIYHRLRDTALRKLMPDLLGVVLGTATDCPLCKRIKKLGE